MQELCGLSANHHLGWVGMSRTDTVDLLMLRTEWHLGVSILYTGKLLVRWLSTYSCTWETALLEL